MVLLKSGSEALVQSPQQTTSPVWMIALVLFVTVGLLFSPLDNTYRALWYGEATDACHVLLFGLLTLFLARHGWPAQRLAMVIFVAALAGGAELLQPLMGRSASWRDLLYGLLGVASAAAWQNKVWRRQLRLLVIAALLAWPVWRTGPSMFDALWAWRTFPDLAISGSPFEARRWYVQDVQLERAGAAMQFHFPANSSSGSSAILFPVIRDWTAYETLEVSFEFEGEPLLFLISVRDGKRLPPELPRYDLWRRYLPGKHDVRIDLNELAMGGNFPPIELARVQSLHLVAFSDRAQTVIVSRIALTDLRQTQ
jgi:hypothetical protein